MWVKLTKTNGGRIYVNLERFDKVEVYKNEDGNDVTMISSCLSEADEDIAVIEVIEPPENFILIGDR